MANYLTKNGDGVDALLKAAGDGTDGDPHVIEHLDTNSAAALVALQAIQAATEALDSATLPTGAATSANQTAQSTLFGGVTETAPATDTASSGLNGRLQRIAQRLTSLIALVPTALGQTTKSASFAVTIASDDDLQGKLGGLTETAPASDTASSGLNGRLQRIAQRLSTIISSGIPVTSVTLPTVIYNGLTNVTTAGTRVVLSASQAIVSGVTIKAKSANTGTIYVGSSTVAAANGYALAAGESVFLEVANLNTINIDASVSGEGVTFIAT